MKRSTLTLSLVALALVTAVALYEKIVVPQNQSRQSQQNGLFAIQPAQVTTLQVQTPETTLNLKRTGEQWQFVGLPGSPQADASAVTALLDRLQNLQAQRQLSTPQQDQDLEQFGLKTPSYRLSLSLSNGNRHELRLGGLDFNGTGLYARLDQGPVVLIDSSLQELLPRSAADWQPLPETPTPSP